jgi:hypothetical protein
MKLSFKFIPSAGVAVCFACLTAFTMQAQDSEPPADAVRMELGQGWARNSVNVPVFRRNSVVTSGQTQYVAFYDSTGTMVLGKRKIGSTDWTVSRTPYRGSVTDAHRSISIMTDGKGVLHVAWDHHNSPLRYCHSVAPDSLALSPPLPMLGNKEEQVTYPGFHRLTDGQLIFLYRDGSSGNGNLVVNRYDPDKDLWIRLHDILIDGEGERNAYWQACTDASGNIHLSWVWRETWDVATNHDMCYAWSADGGTTWLKSDSTAYKLPVTAATAEYAARIPQGSELINQTSMSADPEGNPFIATYFAPSGSDIPQYHLISRDSTGWKVRQLTQRTTPFSLSGGGTKKIPISRPQVLVREQDGLRFIYLIFRDEEHGNRAVLGRSDAAGAEAWSFREITGKSMGSWEPTYDTELWRMQGKLHLFLQKAGQGDGETLELIPPQPVRVLEVPL